MKIPSSAINRAFNLHRQSQTELFMSAAEMDIFMRLMLRPVANDGTIQRIKAGSIARRRSVGALFTQERQMAIGSLRWTQKPGG